MGSAPILVDSTVLLRMLLGEEGADFAVNLFSRAEQGLETLVLPSTALLEAVSAGLIASASIETGEDSYEKLAEMLATSIDVHENAFKRVIVLVDYVDRLVMMGRIIPYTVTFDDISQAVRRAEREGLLLKDAIILTVAEKLKIQKIATFSRHLRSIEAGFTVLPPK